MTNLTKPIVRRLPIFTDSRTEPRAQDFGVVTLCPDGTLIIKKRAQPEVVLSLGALYANALLAEVPARKRIRRGVL